MEIKAQNKKVKMISIFIVYLLSYLRNLIVCVLCFCLNPKKTIDQEIKDEQIKGVQQLTLIVMMKMIKIS